MKQGCCTGGAQMELGMAVLRAGNGRGGQWSWVGMTEQSVDEDDGGTLELVHQTRPGG